MTILKLKTPIVEKETRKIRSGDILYVSGMVITARDEAHHRALELLKRGEKLPYNFEGVVLYHCGPLAKKKGEKWEILAAGPTTSIRIMPPTRYFFFIPPSFSLLWQHA